MKLSKIYTELTEEEREKLDRKLIDRKFSGLDELIAELQEEGFDISRPGLGRYSKKLKEKTERIQRSREYSKAIIEAIPDDEDSTSEALLAITKQTLFDLFLELNISAEKLEKEEGQKLIKSVASLSRAASEIARSSVSLKRYKAGVKKQVKETAKKVREKVKGLTEETIREVEQEILGIG